MVVSDARINANRCNEYVFTGPKSESGKSISRANSLKHGLAGSGVVMPLADLGEIEALTRALQAELDPKSSAGQILVGRMAVLSVQMDRGAEHETATIAMKVRHAVEAFDDERFEEAERLMDSIGESPRINLRKLRKSSDGVDRMIEEWLDLRENLTREIRPSWTTWHLERAVNLTGLKIESAQGSLFHALSKAIWGDSRALKDLETEDRGGDARKAQARHQLAERIDVEIASLKAHRETLDLEMIELDRAEAGSRALFDSSKEAALARRYESEVQGFVAKPRSDAKHLMLNRF